MKINLFTGLIALFLFLNIVVSTNAQIVFEDDFDDSSWTNSQWMIYEMGYSTTPVWDFASIPDSYSGDNGYRADTFSYSQEDEIGPTLRFAQNGQEYEARNLTVSTLIRFDSPDVNPYSSAVEGGILLAVDPENSYNIILQIDYEPSAIEFDFGFTKQISGESEYLIRTDLTGKMDYNIFYSLSVHIDSDGYFDLLLINHETEEKLVNINNFDPNENFDDISIGLLVGGKAVFNDFSLTGNPIVGPPNKVTLVSPSGTTENATPTYKWSADSLSTWYKLWIGDASGVKTFSEWVDSTQVCSSGTCTYTPSTELMNGNYIFYVKSWNENASLWSDGLNFAIEKSIITPSKVTHTTPSGQISDTTPTFAWTEDPASTWYRLWIGNPSGDKVYAQWVKGATVCSGGSCSATPDFQLTNGSYECYVKSWSEYGKTWSDGMGFTVLDPATESEENLFKVGNWSKIQISTNESTTEVTMTVKGTTTIFGVDDVAIIEMSNGSETQTAYRKDINGTVYTYNNGQTSAIEDVYYDFLAGPIGTSWSVTESGGIEQYEIVAIEDVQVPAGFFTGCYKVANNKINPSDGSVMSYDERWWHPEFGYVKMRFHIGLEDEEELVLLEYQASP